MARSDDRKIRCAFCGRTQDQVDKLIAGNGAYICSEYFCTEGYFRYTVCII